MLYVAVIGCTGRMGQALIRLINDNEDIQLNGALVRGNNKYIGSDVGDIAGIEKTGIKITDDADIVFSECDVVIDFTPVGSTARNLELAEKYNTKMVIGSTGLSSKDEALIKKYSKKIPIVYSSNFSVGVNTLFAICEKAGAVLSSDKFETHIDEAHHINKIDAPSGTALSLGKEIAKARGDEFDDVYKYNQERESNKDITFSDSREGDIVGEHTVSFNGKLESLHFVHDAHNRDVFADGAIVASIWLESVKNGLYSMRDVLGI